MYSQKRTPASSSRIDDIEVLRAVAILFVILVHAHGNLIDWPVPAWDLVTNEYFDFYTGVDLFFAVSGFVIARSLIPQLLGSATSEQTARVAAAFWTRRIYRLIPSGWLWLGIILLATVMFNRSQAFTSFHTNFQSVVAAVLSIANFREADAFVNHYDYGPSSPYWTLSLEEQFYLALPIAAICLRRFIWPALIVATIAMFSLQISAWVMVFRIHPILLGVLLAGFMAQPGVRHFEPTVLRHRAAGLGVFATLLLLLASMAAANQHLGTVRIDMIALLSAALVFIAAWNRNYLCPPEPFRSAFLWVGSRSYALYLVHVPGSCFVHETFFRLHMAPRDHVLLLATTYLVLIGALAEANYRFVETPFRRRGAAIAARMSAQPG